MNNQKIRQEAARRKVKLWEIAEALGISDSALSRKLRHELSAQDADQALTAIQRIGCGRAVNEQP